MGLFTIPHVQVGMSTGMEGKNLGGHPVEF
jgi:hypothetical protein